MRLQIQNINKIKEADIALNGLTVIVGENDMGKSTIGRVFFSIIKAVSNMRSLSNESSANKASKHIDSLYKHFYGKNHRWYYGSVASCQIGNGKNMSGRSGTKCFS